MISEHKERLKTNTKIKIKGGVKTMLKTVMVRIIPLFLIVSLLTSCAGGGGGGGGGGNEGSKTAGYKETKSMVLDILKTEEAKKAIKQPSPGEEVEQLKILSSGNGQQIQLAVKEVLTTTDNVKLLQQMVTDPKFAGDFAKATQNELKVFQKDLMKDPEYQQSLIEVMKNPEFNKMLTDALKSSEHRQMVMTVMQDALKSPLYRVELMQMMKKVMEEQSIIQEQKPPGQMKQAGGGGGEEGQKQGESGGKEQGSKEKEKKKKES